MRSTEMIKELVKATSDQILEQMRGFVGSSGGGQWSYQISCMLCEDLGCISGKGHNRSNPKKMKMAAVKFTQQGWRYHESEVICPKCYKDKMLEADVRTK